MIPRCNDNERSLLRRTAVILNKGYADAVDVYIQTDRPQSSLRAAVLQIKCKIETTAFIGSNLVTQWHLYLHPRGRVDRQTHPVANAGINRPTPIRTGLEALVIINRDARRNENRTSRTTVPYGEFHAPRDDDITFAISRVRTIYFWSDGQQGGRKHFTPEIGCSDRGTDARECDACESYEQRPSL